jgi:glutamyl-tRNA synthetase
MPQLMRDGAKFEHAPALEEVIALLKDRANTVNELADAMMLFYREPKPDATLLQQHLTDTARSALTSFAAAAQGIDWTKEAIAALIKQVITDYAMKMPHLAMPLRLLVTGQLQTPSVDAVLALFGREVVLHRLAPYLK